MADDLKGWEAELRALRDEMRNQTGVLALDRRELLAKIENFERSQQEMNLTLQQAEIARKREWDMVRELLGEERQDRREGIQDDRANIKEKRTLFVSATKAVWDKGGQWVIAAVCIWVLLQMQTCSGTNLIKLLGIGG